MGRWIGRGRSSEKTGEMEREGREREGDGEEGIERGRYREREG